jgi:integrase
MAWAEQLPDGRWRACWRDNAQRKRSTTTDPATGHAFTRKAAAERVAGQLETKARHGEHSDARGKSITWGQWCPMWLEHRRVEPSTRAGDVLRVEKYLKPQWGGWRISRIRRPDVQAWVNDLARTDLAAGSIEKVVRLFSASMTAAAATDPPLIGANPCTGVRLPRIAPGHERYLTRGEVELIAYHLNEPYRLAVLLAAGTGLRWGELAGLHWQRVDLATGVLDVVETWDRTRIKTYPKGHNRRGIPLASWLVDALREAAERRPPVQSCGLEHARGGARCRSGLVIATRTGVPLSGQNFGRRQWRDACQLAGVERARLHDLRHTFASWLVQDGVSLQEVQRLLGHASITTTERYSHLGVSQNERVLAALG